LQETTLTAKQEETVDPITLAPQLAALRKRRWFLWSVILVYMPAVWSTLELTHSDKATGTVFGIWVIILIIAVVKVSFAKCPRCGQMFHVHGVTPLYLRKCLHCQLHICADKKAAQAAAKTASS
jgi:hypothetical protein